MTPLQPRLTYEPTGLFSFDLAAAAPLLACRHGETITVTVDGVRFSIRIGDKIMLPPVCRTLHEAKYFSSTILNQILFELIESGRLYDAPPAGDAAPPPRREAPGALPVPVGGPGFESLFDLWERRHLAAGGAPTTPPHWRTLFRRLAAFLGHDEPALVTSQDLRRYHDHLVAEGRAPRTVRHADFAAIRSVFQYAVDHDMLAENPAGALRFKAVRFAARRRMAAFSDEEAATILKASDREAKAARRWIPWLTALTGSRIATIVNLRRQDVVKVDGIWCLSISREAGPVKTAHSERLVPLHEALLARGFVDFARQGGRDRLFIERTRDGFVVEGRERGEAEGLAPYNPGRTTRNRLTEWLHGLGLEIGRLHGKDPHHAWRHWFKEKALVAGVPEKVTDAIVGHAPASIARGYGAVTLAVMQRELNKIESPVPWPSKG